MSRAGPDWDDLRPRLATGGALAAAGVVAVSLGGAVFAATAALACGVMVWELSRMTAPDRPVAAMQAGMLAAAAVLLARALPPAFAFPVLAASALAGAGLAGRYRAAYAAFAAAICVAGYGLATFHDAYGALWLVWLVLVVVATDVAGYFGGRAIGGRKFWPSISPSKTWAGTVCGWAAAGLVGAAFLTFTTAGRDIVWISMAVSFGAQMGDIAESAMKRMTGVKDSSSLLPGHGGLLDRFDGFLGAALPMLLTALIVDVPEVRF